MKILALACIGCVAVAIQAHAVNSQNSETAYRADVAAFSEACIQQPADRNPDKLYVVHQGQDANAPTTEKDQRALGQWKEYPPASEPWDQWTGSWSYAQVFHGARHHVLVDLASTDDSGDWIQDSYYCYDHTHNLTSMLFVRRSFSQNAVLEARRPDAAVPGHEQISCHAYLPDQPAPTQFCEQAAPAVHRDLIVYSRLRDLPFGRELSLFYKLNLSKLE
jgi:hypothetical protein